MAENSVVEINMFGRISDAEAVWEVAQAASAASSTAPWDNGFGTAEFLVVLQQAEAEGRAVSIQIHDNWELFEELRNTCQEARMSYVAYTGDPGAEGWSAGLTWRPGMQKECSFLMNGDEPVVSIKNLQKVAGHGIAEVNALVDNVSVYASAGVVELDDGFAAAWQEYAGEGPSAAV